jgi:hypothetical protein
VGLVRSNHPENYAGSSDATGRAFRARKVKGDGPDKKGYPGPPGRGFGGGGGDSRPLLLKTFTVVKTRGRPRSLLDCGARRMMMMMMMTM